MEAQQKQATKVINERLAVDLVSDDKFLAKMPEFKAIASKFKARLATAPGKCSSCKKKRMIASLMPDFMRTLTSLTDTGIARFKQTIKATSVIYYVKETKTGSVTTKEI